MRCSFIFELPKSSIKLNSLTVLVFLITIVSAWAIVQEQFYGATSFHYVDFATDGFTSGTYLLTKKKLGIITTDSFVKCIYFCTVTPNCHGFVKVVNNNHTFCFLQKYDRCADPSATFVYTEGVQTYDLRPKEDPLLPLTCQQRCLLKINADTPRCKEDTQYGTSQSTCLFTGPRANSSSDCSNNEIKPNCKECGRENCCGIRCEVCPRLCWELPSIQTGWVSAILWPKRTPREVTCIGDWQQINRNAKSTDIYSATEIELGSDSKLWLKLSVIYSNEETLVSYFDEINIVNTMSLKVGNYLGGNAGNFWEAPFTGRRYHMDRESNCLYFYYAPGNCTANGITTYKDQVELNATASIRRALSWKSECRSDLHNTRVEKILYRVSVNKTALQEMRDRAANRQNDLCNIS